MPKSISNIDATVVEAFRTQELLERVNNTKIGCFLVITLMPLGIPMDYYVYPKLFWLFVKLRIWSAVVTSLMLAFLSTRYGEKFSRWLAFLVPLVPVFFIDWMIATTTGFSSPYYAGLNLVLLAVGFVLRWTFLESLLSVTFVLLVYIATGILHGGPVPRAELANNLFFMLSMDIIAVVGNYFQYKSRFREFVLRYQLNQNKHELEETNRKLVELDRLKSRFFANVSHELRTPLTLLLAPLETLIQRYARTLEGNAHEMLLTMQANGMRLLKLINDLLDLIRVEAGRMDIKNEPLVVKDFIGGLASAVKQLAAEKHITLEAPVAAEIQAVLIDRDKLEKVLLNLLFNALKFTPAHGHIWLRTERKEGELVLSVADTGVGIAEKNLPFVFDRFWQADSSSKRKFQGVGIGLALVKELVEMMEGTVSVQSQEGKGANFTVRLPYRAAEPPARRENGAPFPAGKEAEVTGEWLANLYRRAEFFPTMNATRDPAKPVVFSGRQPVVLVADDEPDMRQFLKSELSEHYDVLEAADGLQALEKAEQYLPDIVLLDMMMPEMDGLEVCRALRLREATVNIPVILLTARADEETKFDALQIGANDFLAKPFSSTELQARIKNLIESHHYQRKLTKQNQALTSAIEQIKETEMQLVQSEKLSSLGRLSAGIIHEINNPLNFSMTGLFALRNRGKQLPAEHRAEFEAIVNDIEEGLKRVRNIVSDLRTFTHPGGGTGEPVEADDAAAAALRFLAGEWKDKVRIHQNIPANQGLWANRNKLIHVLVNLLQNAIDALGEKTFADGEQPQIWIEGQVVGDRSRILIRDNGPGIDPKITDKIFDPFFTTKEVGKGMGLGLSICYRIVQGYGGTLTVRSERGQFCEFTIDFPGNAEAAAEIEIEHGESLRL